MRRIRPEDLTPEALDTFLASNPTEDEVKEALLLADATFTEAQIQRFLEICSECSLEDVLRELEETQRQFEQTKQ